VSWLAQRPYKPPKGSAQRRWDRNPRPPLLFTSRKSNQFHACPGGRVQAALLCRLIQFLTFRCLQPYSQDVIPIVGHFFRLLGHGHIVALM